MGLRSGALLNRRIAGWQDWRRIESWRAWLRRGWRRLESPSIFHELSSFLYFINAIIQQVRGFWGFPWGTDGMQGGRAAGKEGSRCNGWS